MLDQTSGVIFYLMVTENKMLSMLAKLDQLYEREENLKKEIQSKIAELDQIQDDIELAQTCVMYQNNKQHRTFQIKER